LRETGQTAAEYLGVLLVVAVIVAAVATTHVGEQIACTLKSTVGQIAGGDGADCRATSDAAAAETADSDGDGLTDAQEAQLGSNPQSADSDADGVPDDQEAEAGTNPNAADSDGDGLTDAEEIEQGLNPISTDSDGDGLADDEEIEQQTDPLNPDTDQDGHEDGDDGDPRSYDAGVDDIAAGAICGDATWLMCPDDDDPVRASLEYFTGQILTGLIAVGDVRDFVAAILRGQWGDAAWAAIGVVPYVGDAGKIGKKVLELIGKFPTRRAELLRLIPKILPERLQRYAFDAATHGGWSKLADGGASETAIRQLAEQGNDLRRIADNATLTGERLTDAEATAIWNRVHDPVWGNHSIGERLGVETALSKLQKDPNIDVLVTGRPVPGRRNVGPDIVAIDRRTNKLIVVEAKGTTGGSWQLGHTWMHTELRGRGMYETSRRWLATEQGRYLNALARSSDPAEREAARRLRSVAAERENYDVMIVQSRPAGKGGYGAGMDDAVAGIKDGGGVDNISVVDVERP
jgi:hypothetical protein